MNTDMLRKAVIPTSVGVAGLSVGGGFGYILGRRRERGNRLRLIQEAEENMREYNERVVPGLIRGVHYRRPDDPPFEKKHDIEETGRVPYYTVPVEHDTLEIKEGKLHALNLHPEPNVFEETVELVEPVELDDAFEPKPKNVFVDGKIYKASDDDWNWEAELNARSDKSIYVITRDEFDADDMGNRQGSVTFYEGDRMVCDALGEPIYNWTSHIGSELPFGHGSEDENVVFIRNESLKWEYEVARDPGYFAEEQQGYEIEMAYEEKDIKHAHSPLKMRRE